MTYTEHYPQPSPLVFVDEYGQPNLNYQLEGVSTFYIVTGVIVQERDIDEVRGGMNYVSKKFFGRGEIKSSTVGQQHDKRLLVLKRLCLLPWKSYSIAIDKRHIDPESGLVYKEPFIKFTQRQLYSKLLRALGEPKLYADEYGRKEFMDGFNDYIKQHAQRNLFYDHVEIRFVPSAGERCVQLADFISGSLARVYDPKLIARADDIMNTLAERVIGIEPWPLQGRYVAYRPPIGTSLFDRLIHDKSLEAAERFIASSSGLDDDLSLAQVETIRFLRDQAMLFDPARYIHAAEIIDYVSERTKEPLTESAFRLKIIAKLRDNSLLIASSPNGYKLPTRVRDMDDFAAHGDLIIRAMLRRLHRARELLFLASNGSLDILEHPRYSRLQAIMDAYRGEPSGG